MPAPLQRSSRFYDQAVNRENNLLENLPLQLGVIAHRKSIVRSFLLLLVFIVCLLVVVCDGSSPVVVHVRDYLGTTSRVKRSHILPKRGQFQTSF